MRKLMNFISESLLDDEDELLYSDKLSSIELTGVEDIDYVISSINGKVKSPMIYNYVEKLIEISKKLSTEFRDVDLNSVLPRITIKSIDDLASTKLKEQPDPLELMGTVNTLKAVSEFINNIKNNPKMKYFTDSNLFKEHTYLGSASRIKYKEGYVITWEIYDEFKNDIDADKLENDLRSIKIKTKANMKFDRREVDGNVTLRMYFYK